MENKILEALVESDVCGGDNLEQLYHKVRDRDDVSVLRCKESGVIFLSRTDHINPSFYKNKDEFNSRGGGGNYDQVKFVVENDDKRRARQFKDVIKDKVWLDIGTGMGGVLDLLSLDAKKTYAIEPQAAKREFLSKKGHEVFVDIDEFPYGNLEVVTLFHVFEHIINPVEFLKKVSRKMKKGAYLIIEVPHAKDLLLKCKKFKEFTFWEEHLILHTKRSLKTFLEAAGFNNILIKGFQRYPFLNHLKWMFLGKPSGYGRRLGFVDKTYVGLLKMLNKTDTLVAITRK